ncbi:hypothetical protein AAA799E16_00751 [Marine Group I thaumarchaeote SCGC AAA799-E16]|uniref:Uncharacterized protein n=3 Tax=Marine Group I TaxID=905826 RepID=A0A087S990_9ARCH|nr:hypothetical protein AAA799E16_00751 [Marine Group I thaumarchaeote SCGC AAA799-E16]KFM18445.1 hypothetical protein SCCGRSA3_01131 [Marine Group I thaumarchaeote SCGC RSA3]KFM22294.1 hypothetical protein AAA799B03_00044 [Marine Group I thaumarchaeote SCGC AAA799-B03]
MEKITDKNQNQSSVTVKDDPTPKKSICGVMKDNTVGVIQKMESEVPPIFQGYADLYTRYLHFIQDIFGTCSLAEKQYFDKMDIDQNVLKMYDDYLKSVTTITKSQIDLSTDFVQRYIQFRLSSIDSWDKYTHTCIDMYAKFLAGGTSSRKSKSKGT